jgi:hypothetical protein
VRRIAIPTLAALAAAALVVSAAASRPEGNLAPSAKKTCRYVVRQVRGKKKRLRVCRAVRADLRLAVATNPSTSLSPGEHVSFPVRISNRGPDTATRVYLDVGFPPGYRNISATQRGTACSTDGTYEVGIILDCPKTTLRRGKVLQVTVEADLGYGQLQVRDLGDILFHALSRVADPNDFNNDVAVELDLTNCSDSYPDLCIPPPPPSLHCADIAYNNFQVIYAVANPDPQGFDPDHDGIGCEG